VWSTAVRTAGGACYGDPASAGYNDSLAILVGSNYGKNQAITAVAYHNGSSGTAEIELLLRSSYTATQVFQYEVTVGPTGISIVKWQGNQGAFSFLPLINGTTGSYIGGGLNNGDTFVAAITGDATTTTITVTQNGTLIAQANDTIGISGNAPYVTGNPGIGFDIGGGGTAANIGWKSYSVVTT
jgi:hypothetical protein